MTNSTQTTPQPESKKEIPELSLEQLQQVSGGSIFYVDSRVNPKPTPYSIFYVD